jgi:NAD(P)-dependent dehydrogenase (short-subunit alcohol dehydrogenase family)
MTDTVALVTGASRGAGKGIARALASKGHHVYFTGRSTQASDSAVGGTIADTEAEIRATGGNATGLVCDHSDDAQVKAVFDRIAAEQGRLDILVNNAAFLPDATANEDTFWKKPLAMADLITVGLRSHYVASYYAAPMMVEARRGLIVNTGYYGAVCYFHGAAYGAQKAGSDKMAADMAKELRPYGVSAVSVWMGNLKSERTLAYLDTLPEERRTAIFASMETTDFTGLVIDALARDPELPSLSGQALIGAELARKYGITDLDGSSPPSFRETMGGPPQLHPSLLG